MHDRQELLVIVVYVRGADATVVLQDDTYTESYISTIGVDFVRPCPVICCGSQCIQGQHGSMHERCRCVPAASHNIVQSAFHVLLQKIRTVELEGKIIKLQIVRTCLHPNCSVV
jgi:hypothetical protein